MRRAAHQLVDSPKVFDDPLAVPMAGDELRAGIDSEASGSRSLRAFVVARSRYAEDQLATAVQRGVTQYVLLGAGFDTFGYRNPYPELLAFEVDHPATQAHKRGRLRDAGIAIPDDMTFVPVDFERQRLPEQLEGAGFRVDMPAVFSWLGVGPYLTRDAFDSTLRFMAARPGGSAVVFDYATEVSALSARERAAFDVLAARVAAAGEPFQLFFTTAELTHRLSALGFTGIEDLGAHEINQRYFDGRTDSLRVAASLAHLVWAQI